MWFNEAQMKLITLVSQQKTNTNENMLWSLVSPRLFMFQGDKDTQSFAQ